MKVRKGQICRTGLTGRNDDEPRRTAQIEAISAAVVITGTNKGRSSWQNGEKLGQNRAELRLIG